MNLITLKETILGSGEVNGISLHKEYETDTFYVYRRSDIGYEVFMRKSAPLCVDFENRVYSETDFKEIYPKSKDFGVWAWCVSDLDKAKQLINKKNAQ